MTLQGSEKVCINGFKNTCIPNSSLWDESEILCARKVYEQRTDQIALVPQKKDVIEGQTFYKSLRLMSVFEFAKS